MRQIDKATATDRHSLDSAPDDLLVHQARTGDDRAFDILYLRYYQEIRAFVTLKLDGDAATAEDIASEVFTKVFRFLDRYQAGGSFRGWLYQIARNATIDHFRRSHTATSLDQIGEIVSPAIALDEHAIALEARTSLLAALDTLPPVPRRIVELRLKGFGLPDICADLGMELSAVKSAQHRAFAKLRIELRGVGIGVTEETSERS
ncbi:MAG: RNA polymerase sigma factor [Thermomicrobiales bacterium]